MKDFPLNELLAATDLAKVQESILLIFGHINKKLKLSYVFLLSILETNLTHPLNPQTLPRSSSASSRRGHLSRLAHPTPQSSLLSTTHVFRLHRLRTLNVCLLSRLPCLGRLIQGVHQRRSRSHSQTCREVPPYQDLTSSCQVTRTNHLLESLQEAASTIASYGWTAWE